MNNLFKDKNQTTYYGTLIVWDRFVVVRNKKHVSIYIIDVYDISIFSQSYSEYLVVHGFDARLRGQWAMPFPMKSIYQSSTIYVKDTRPFGHTDWSV